MIHRKKDHKSFVRDCNLFLEDKCRYNEESCWFIHRGIEAEEIKNVGKQASELVFRNAQENQEPPLEEEKEETQEVNN